MAPAAGSPPAAGGRLYVIAAPSGAGKTSLVRALTAANPNLSLSVSHTTRAPRAGERDGVDYHFVDEATFAAMVTGDAFLEHARVFDRSYGTSRGDIEARIAAGRDVVLEIDWQGAAQIRAAMPTSVGIFILPPSLASLRARLEGRGQDSVETIERRMRDARTEISHYGEFDFLVFNERFERALGELQAIFTAHRLQRPRQEAAHRDLLAALLED